MLHIIWFHLFEIQIQTKQVIINKVRIMVALRELVMDEWWEGNWLEWGHRELSERVVIFYILFWIVVTWVFTCVKTHLTDLLRSNHFILIAYWLKQSKSKLKVLAASHWTWKKILTPRKLWMVLPLSASPTSSCATIFCLYYSHLLIFFYSLEYMRRFSLCGLSPPPSIMCLYFIWLVPDSQL